MKLRSFRIYKYKSITDSGEVVLGDLNVIVGKNEAGKTSLLRALHKFNPFRPDPYRIEREWPRGQRKAQTDSQVVAETKFELDDGEIASLQTVSDRKISSPLVTVTKDYAGRFEVAFGDGLFPNKIHPSDIEATCAALPTPTQPVGQKFAEAASGCRDEALLMAREGRFSELEALAQKQLPLLEASKSPDNPEPQHSNETNYVSAYGQAISQVAAQLTASPTMQKKAHEYVVNHLPTFIYMDEYRAFQGTAFLDQIKQRVVNNAASEEDKSLLMILELSGLSLDAEVAKAQSADREQRQYDLDDAGATLTNEIEGRWGQRKYTVQFRADGHQFFTMVEDEFKTGLIRLEERSKGFQWFFSFDLLFMHESRGTFKGCVLLLDEPGLHLHPDAQKDLLRRLEAYSASNVLIYTTHLPFMLDLKRPDQIKVIADLDKGSVVTDDLSRGDPQGKFTLQAALGMSGSSSFLISKRNLVVEGAHDYWLISELSNLLVRSGRTGLPDDVHVTAAGGASEAAYITAFMIGQELDVVTVLDSDAAGREASDQLVKKWLLRYKDAKASVVMIGDVVSDSKTELEIEDLFPETYYKEKTEEVYANALAGAGIAELSLVGNDGNASKVERALKQIGHKFNKGSVAKKIRAEMVKMKTISELPDGTARNAEALFAKINASFG